MSLIIYDKDIDIIVALIKCMYLYSIYVYTDNMPIEKLRRHKLLSDNVYQLISY